MPASRRYSGSVSGPQLAVPRPRWAASRWMIVSATGTRSMSWSAAARSAARKWVTETWRGVVELDPEAGPGARRRARASGRRRGRRSPAGGRTGRTGRSRSTPRCRRGRRARGPGRSRCGPDPNQRRSSASGTTSSTVPTRARSVSASGSVARLGHRDAAIGKRRVGRLVRDHVPGRGDVLAAYDRRRAIVLDADEPSLEPIDAELGPALGHPADPVVVGRRSPQREGRRRGQQRVDEAAVRVERDRARRDRGPRGHRRDGGARRLSRPAAAGRRPRSRPAPTAARPRS